MSFKESIENSTINYTVSITVSLVMAVIALIIYFIATGPAGMQEIKKLLATPLSEITVGKLILILIIVHILFD